MGFLDSLLGGKKKLAAPVPHPDNPDQHLLKGGYVLEDSVIEGDEVLNMVLTNPDGTRLNLGGEPIRTILDFARPSAVDLIAIAHPDARDALTAEARALNLL
jgi:hypothetical protein